MFIFCVSELIDFIFGGIVLKYGLIVEPELDHKYLSVSGDFSSNDIFVSQAELCIGDIITRNEYAWFLIKGINVKDQFHFEYIGETRQPKDIIHTLSLEGKVVF